MKKKILAVSCLIAMLILSACNKNSDVMNNTEITPASPTDSASESPSSPIQTTSNTSDQSVSEYQENISVSPTPTLVDPDTDGYEIIRDGYSKGKDIAVSYPQIKGLKDTNRQKVINEILKQAVMSYFNDTSYLERNSYLQTLDISYEIKWKGNNLLSVQYYGWEDYSDAPHPNNIYFTTNINMKTGELINLQDVFYIDEIIVGSIIKNSSYVGPLDPDDAELMEEVQNNMLDYLAEYSITDNSFYFTQDSFCISIDVSHAIGDHADLATKYSDLISSINPESEIWKDFEGSQNKAIDNPAKSSQDQLSHRVTLSDLYQFTEFENQSFNVNLKNWGAVRFVSGWDFGDKLQFYLTDDSGTILYRFPGYYDNSWHNQTISAVAFRDVNEDGFKDVIIIAAKNNGFTSCDIYFQKDQEYVQVPALYDDLNLSNTEYDTVDKIVDYMKARGNAIVAQALYD